MYKQIDIIQGSQSWLDYRKSKIGGSDAPIVMGISPYCTPYQLWLRKMNAIPEQEKNDAMQRGNDLEPVVRNFLEEVYGLLLPATTIESLERPWQFASMDCLSNDGMLAAEIKCPGEFDHATAKSGKVPLKYIPQLQHQLHVLGLEKMIYASYDGEEVVHFEVERKDGYINEMLDIERAFMDCMLDFTPPQLTNKDYVFNTSADWKEACQEWHEIQRQLKRIETREKQLRQTMIGMCNDTNTTGSGVKIVKVVKKGAIDYARIPELLTMDLDQFRKETTSYWKIIPSKHEVD